MRTSRELALALRCPFPRLLCDEFGQRRDLSFDARGFQSLHVRIPPAHTDRRPNNSWMHNIPRLIKGPVRCTLQVARSDAARMGLHSGELVRMCGEAGSVVVPVEVSDEMMDGVVCMPHGWGHGRPGIRLAVAASRPGASINDVIGAASVDSLTGMSILNSVEVRLELVHHTAAMPATAASEPSPTHARP